MKQVNK